jgi:lambda repressor-like predicted transcriptional regulator
MIIVYAQYIAGATIVSMMRRNHLTIREVARRAGLSMAKVRGVREYGVRGYERVLSWLAYLGHEVECHGGWISVHDRMPPDNRDVLVCLNKQTSEIIIGRYSNNSWNNDSWDDSTVSHWMPLSVIREDIEIVREHVAVARREIFAEDR